MTFSKTYKPLLLGIALASVTTAGIAQTGAPVEKNKANSDYKPAFAAKPRIGSVTTKTPYTVTVINTELKSPWGITVLPDGRLLISSKPGAMQILTTMGKVVKTITGFPPGAISKSGWLAGCEH